MSSQASASSLKEEETFLRGWIHGTTSRYYPVSQIFVGEILMEHSSTHHKILTCFNKRILQLCSKFFNQFVTITSIKKGIIKDNGTIMPEGNPPFEKVSTPKDLYHHRSIQEMNEMEHPQKCNTSGYMMEEYLRKSFKGDCYIVEIHAYNHEESPFVVLHVPVKFKELLVKGKLSGECYFIFGLTSNYFLLIFFFFYFQML
jgi:hypothetical protein